MAVTASVTPAGVFGAPGKVVKASLEQVPFASFASHLNATFQVQGDSGPVVGLQLVEVGPTPAPPIQLPNAFDAANEKFSLLFSGPLDQPLEQDTYWFECPGIGRFTMFIVPIGSTETTHYYYEAIFNRPTGGPLPQAGEADIPVGRPARSLSRSQRKILK